MARPSFERYEILEELGQGGMSVVYRARDRQLSREVAVKILHEFLAGQDDARRRFHREAVAVAKLHHPGILEIFDYSGPEARESFIVTELIDGPTLRQFMELRGGSLRHPEIAALLVYQLNLALRHAHDHGVIHRDLKPENVMLTRGGDLKLMDFGIAQISDDKRLTMTGTLLGSPAHMAPEVIDGHRPDRRSDLFSLGTILYWLATGRLPFEAPNPSALFRKILEGRYEDPQKVEPRLGNGLARIIRRLLEPDPGARFESAAELEDALAQEIRAAGLGAPEVECKAFFRDPDGYGLALSGRLVRHLRSEGALALKNKQLAKAMDCFNRILALEPGNQEIRSLVSRATRRQVLGRRVLSGALVGGLLVLFALGAAGTARFLDAAADRGPSEAPRIDKRRPRWALKTLPPNQAKAPHHQDGEPRARPELRPAEAGLAGTEPAPDGVERPAGPSSQVDGGGASDEAARAKPPTGASETRGTLKVRIGNSFADIVLDGRRVEAGVYQGAVLLEEGRHQVWVEKPGQGRFLPRIVEVDAVGEVFELREGGERVPVREMMFYVPRPDQDAPRGWVREAQTDPP